MNAITKSLTHANAARDAIKTTVRSVYRTTYAAGSEYAAAYNRLVSKIDVVDTMVLTVEFILGAEHLAAMATEAAEAARAVLAEQLAETGAGPIRTNSHTAFLSKKRSWVSIDMPDQIPAQFMRQPPPTPDKDAIRAAITAGDVVPGASLVVPNDSTLCIRKT